MPVDRYRNLRFRTLNNCFRDVHRKYDIDDLVDACNEAVRRVYLDNCGVTKRTIQKDLQALQLPPYSIRLKENFRSGHKRLYRYEDPSFYLEVLTDQEKSQIEEAVKVIKSLPDNPQYRWVQTMLEQLQFGRNIAARSVIAFQYNLELKGIEHFSPIGSPWAFLDEKTDSMQHVMCAAIILYTQKMFYENIVGTPEQ